MSDTMNRGGSKMGGRGGSPAGRGGPDRQGGGFGGGPMAFDGEKAKDFMGTMRKLGGYLGRYRVAMAVVALIAAASTAFSVLCPALLGRATTVIFEGANAIARGTGFMDFAATGRILLLVAGLYILSAALSFVQSWIMGGIAAKITYRLRKDISEKIDRLPLRYFDGVTRGDLISRITNDVDVLGETLGQSLMQLISAIVTVAGILAIMFSISWLLSLVALVMLPLSLGSMTLLMKRSQDRFTEQQNCLGAINGHVEEMFGAHLVVKAECGEKKSIAAFEKLNARLYKAARSSQFISGLMIPIMSLVSNAGYVAIIVVGGALTLARTIAVGDIQAFIQYVNSFTQPLTQLAGMSSVLQQTAAAAERIFGFLDEAEEPAEAVASGDIDRFEGRVSFENLAFSYVPGIPVIKGFSAIAEKGAKIAIVGPTGAGKTTIVKLLMRFYEPDSGAIRVDDRDIATIPRADVRRHFGMVLQDTWLFSGSIMENIRYGRPDASDAEVVEAARMAHADHFIRAQSEGYQTVINEEATNISQGQKQLITIARAILADPAMLIFDEATSSIDTRTEVMIQDAMDTLMRGRTSFVIAHRLSTVRNADLILVMQDGDIAEQGRHDELLARNGLYAEIYRSQFDATAGDDVKIAG